MKLPYLKIEQAVESDDSGFFRDLMAAHPDLPLPALLAAIEPIADPDDPDKPDLSRPFLWERWIIGRHAESVAVLFFDEGVFPDPAGALLVAQDHNMEYLVHAIATRHPLSPDKVAEVHWSAFFFENKTLARSLFKDLPVDWTRLGESLKARFGGQQQYMNDWDDEEWAFADEMAALAPSGFASDLLEWAGPHAYHLTDLMARREQAALGIALTAPGEGQPPRGRSFL
jgi:hypothetical protein